MVNSSTLTTVKQRQAMFGVCPGPAGPEGPQGPQGPQGPEGTAGPAGTGVNYTTYPLTVQNTAGTISYEVFDETTMYALQSTNGYGNTITFINRAAVSSVITSSVILYDYFGPPAPNGWNVITLPTDTTITIVQQDNYWGIITYTRDRTSQPGSPNNVSLT
jgi:hypothetical protein